MKTSGMLKQLVSAATRKKEVEEVTSPLARVLSLFDLTLLGVGTTLGVGAYVLAGQVAREMAGPAVVIAFAIAAIASLLGGFCYAEFAARVPRTGSVYVYAYVTVGELIAFAIGWDLVLEYAIATASLGRAMTAYFDNLFNNAVEGFFRTYMAMNVRHMAAYPDFIAFVFIILLSLLLIAGVKESSYINSVLTILNLLTLGTVVIAGAIKSNPSNWNISINNIPPNTSHVGSGGFAPFGFAGIVRGAATSFFGYVGFDVIATTGEEARNPRRNIPLAIMISLAIVFVAYFGTGTVLTMMEPYYVLDKKAPYPVAFDDLDMQVVKWIVTIGGIFALCTSLFGGMFPLPRILFAMAQDGLLFKFLGRVNSKSKTPTYATLFSGLLCGLLVLLFNLEQLVDMMSIGTLMAYSLVALCVIILRLTEDADLSNPTPKTGCIPWLRAMINADRERMPTPSSRVASMYLVMVFCVLSLVLCMLVTWGSAGIYDGNLPEIVSAIIIAVVLIVLLILLSLQPRSNAAKLYFAVPLMPSLPCLSILLNMYLMTQLDSETWVRFIVWLIIGGVLYFSYSIRNSVERRREADNGTDADRVAAENKDTRPTTAGTQSAPK